MTNEEFRADLLATAAARAEAHASGIREAFLGEALERLRDAGEIPDTEACPERVEGKTTAGLKSMRSHSTMPTTSFTSSSRCLTAEIPISSAITLTEAREQGFNRLMGCSSRRGRLAHCRALRRAGPSGRLRGGSRRPANRAALAFMWSPTGRSASGSLRD